MTARNIAIWVLRLLAALILLQTLYFKFTAQPESVELFTMLHMEPWGRIGTGIMELIAALLILFPRTTGIGAALGSGLMAGAIFFHLTKLGIYVNGDPLLFIYALLVLIASVILMLSNRARVMQMIARKTH